MVVKESKARRLSQYVAVVTTSELKKKKGGSGPVAVFVRDMLCTRGSARQQDLRETLHHG